MGPVSGVAIEPNPGRRLGLDAWQRPRLDADRGVGPGVAAGVAREIGVDPLVVRISFVVLAIVGGAGAVIYLGLWAGMRGASLDGYEPRPKGRSERDRLIGLAMVNLGVALIASEVSKGLIGWLVWPTLLVGAAFAVIWSRSDRGDLSRWAQGSMVVPRMLLGVGLLAAGVVIALSRSLSLWQALSATAVSVLVLGGVVALLGPVISDLGTDLVQERRRRIRTEERADMAAHLHDSVLQTLTLIQKRSDDSEVVGLARRQERELRSWLFSDRGPNADLGFRSRLEGEMARVEQAHGTPIEIVVVGDARVTPDLAAIIAASREAATNAAKHSGAARIDVYAEVGGRLAEVFVRDQGKGFDTATIDDDRVGIRDSILARMERHGGRAEIQAASGTGTEVELHMPYEPEFGSGV